MPSLKTAVWIGLSSDPTSPLSADRSIFVPEITLLILFVVIEPLFEVRLISPFSALIELFITIEPLEVTLISGVSNPWNCTCIELLATPYTGSCTTV